MEVPQPVNVETPPSNVLHFFHRMIEALDWQPPHAQETYANVDIKCYTNYCNSPSSCDDIKYVDPRDRIERVIQEVSHEHLEGLVEAVSEPKLKRAQRNEKLRQYLSDVGDEVGNPVNCLY
jgi:hypothetical protein